MRWSLQIPVMLYKRDETEIMEPADLREAPFQVRMAIAEALWQLGAGLSKTCDAITVAAELETDTNPEEVRNGPTNR